MRMLHSPTSTTMSSLPPPLLKSISKDKLWNEDDATMYSDASSTSSSSSVSDIGADDHLLADRPSKDNSPPSRIYHSAKMWLMVATEEHRYRLSDQVKKNWIRLLISVIVVVIQFVWFASYYIGFNQAASAEEANLHSSQILAGQQQPPAADKDNRLSSLIYSLPAYPLPDAAVIVNITDEPVGGSENNILSTMATKTSSAILPATVNHHHHHCMVVGDRTASSPLYQQQQKQLPPEPWPSLLWRLLSGIKLALMLIALELIRLFDALVVIFQRPRHQDKRNRKSFIDLSYIERNRGYK